MPREAAGNRPGQGVDRGQRQLVQLSLIPRVLYALDALRGGVSRRDAVHDEHSDQQARAQGARSDKLDVKGKCPCNECGRSAKPVEHAKDLQPNTDGRSTPLSLLRLDIIALIFRRFVTH